MLKHYKLIFLLLLPLFTYAKKGAVAIKRTVVKETALSQGANIAVINKFGKVNIVYWDKNEFKTTVTITGFGNSDKEASDIANAVQIKDIMSPSSVRVQTDYNANNAKKWLRNFGSRNTRDQVTIDYDVYIPRSIGTLEIANNFGDVLAEELANRTVINLNYGYYNIGSAKEKLTLRMNYCDKGKIDKADEVVVESNYSTLTIGTVGNLTVASNSCKYRIDRVNSITMKSNYDDYFVGKVTYVKANSNYINVKLDELGETGIFATNYADIIVKRVSTAFKSFRVDANYTDVKLNIPSRVNFAVNAALTYGDVKVDGFQMHNVVSEKKHGSMRYKGATQQNDNGLPTIQINGAYTDVKISNVD
ncbi:hypothetical protein LX64_03477 [Chitinophaga skermanii]|uniref:Uncharacterized protein n=1 Tax=Chitinophaga skermanii TaxID=331697 RepID=A0A327QD12_9BACT|nr:DUF4097 family beta strand repeat-containing protein [Chitinophaga skermanii]RAJ02459.1 hypothetical protein LX64_03477 [Chitinophaga skermanii]